MEGFSTVDSNEPLKGLPPLDEMKGKKIALKLTGGVGDVVIAIGGLAPVLAEAGAEVTAIVKGHQTKLITRMKGIAHAIETQKFNNPQARNKFDYLVEYSHVFNERRSLRAGSYYERASERAGISHGPGEFEVKRLKPLVKCLNCTVAIHPTASNPNRVWDFDNWKKVAYAIREAGCDVVWLGTKDEPGFSDDRITKLSDIDEDMSKQVATLARCSFFMGSDSGFAHLAGVLKIPGVVLFSNTWPADVIGEYQDLMPVCRFDLEQPTRALSHNCETSQRLMKAITVQQVLEDAERLIPSIDPQFDIRSTQVGPVSVKRSLLLLGDRCEFVRKLREVYDVTEGCELDSSVNPADFDIVLDATTGTTFGLKVGGKDVKVVANISTVTRAIREILME